MDLSAPFLPSRAVVLGIADGTTTDLALMGIDEHAPAPAPAVRFPDLTDPAVRALPIYALALAWSVIERASIR